MDGSDRLTVYLLHDATDGGPAAQTLHDMLAELTPPVDLWPLGTGSPDWVDVVLVVLSPAAAVEGAPTALTAARVHAAGRAVVLVRTHAGMQPPAVLATCPTFDLNLSTDDDAGLPGFVAHLRALAAPSRAVVELEMSVERHRRKAESLHDAARIAYEHDVVGPVQAELAAERRRAMAVGGSAERPHGDHRPHLTQRRGAPPSSKVRIVNYPTRGWLPGRHDPEEALAALTAALGSGKRILTVQGPAGSGKTALMARLCDSLSGAGAVPVDLVVYVSVLEFGLLAPSAFVTVLAAALDTTGLAPAAVEDARDGTRPWYERLEAVFDALGTTRVLVLVDDADSVLDDRRRLQTGMLGPLVDQLLRAGAPTIQLVLGLTVDDERCIWEYGNLVQRVRLATGQRPLHSFRAAVAALDPHGCLALSGALDNVFTEPPDAPTATAHAIESLTSLLRSDPDAALPVVRGRTAAEAERLLIDRKLDTLHRTARRVVEALAVFDRPQTADAVDAVLDDVVAGPNSRATLDRLTADGFVRSDGTTYFLPVDDVRPVLDRIPPDARTARCESAYTFYDRRRRPKPSTFADLTPILRQVEVLIHAGCDQRALELMDSLEDHFLGRWGQGHALLPWRRDLTKRLLDAGDAESIGDHWSNVSRIAEALREVGAPAAALRELAAAKDEIAELTGVSGALVAVQQGAALYDLGSCSDAKRYFEVGYRDAVPADATEASETARAKCHALSGLMLCHIETGAFQHALDLYAEAMKHLDPLIRTDVPAPSDQLLHAALTVNKGIALRWLDRPADAWTAVDDAARRLQAAGAQHLLGRVNCVRASLALDADDHQQACLHATAALQQAVAAPTHTLMYEANVRLALVGLLSGDDAMALPAARAADRLARSVRQFAGTALLGLVQLRLDDVQAAKRSFTEAISKTTVLQRREGKNFELLFWHSLLQFALASFQTDYDQSEISVTYKAACRQTGNPSVAKRRIDRLLSLVRAAVPGRVIDVFWTEDPQAGPDAGRSASAR